VLPNIKQKIINGTSANISSLIGAVIVSGAGLDALNLKIQYVPYRAAGLSRAILAVNIAHFPTLTNRKVAAPLLGLQCGAAFNEISERAANSLETGH
jgi:hypothetical protein